VQNLQFCKEGWKHDTCEPLFNTFHPTKWYISSMIGKQEAEILIAFFGNPKHKEKNWGCAWQDFGIQNSFWIKVKLDPMIRWKRLDQINMHNVYNIHFFNGHKSLCLWFTTHYQTKEKWKNIKMLTSKISSFFLKIMVFSPK
jgi:hypothetical protein